MHALCVCVCVCGRVLSLRYLCACAIYMCVCVSVCVCLCVRVCVPVCRLFGKQACKIVSLLISTVPLNFHPAVCHGSTGRVNYNVWLVWTERPPPALTGVSDLSLSPLH